jgi:hypothetical protein
MAPFLGGCSPPAEPTPDEVQRKVAQMLAAGEDHLRLTELHKDGDNHYSGQAKSDFGTTYAVNVTTTGRHLQYSAATESLILGGQADVPASSLSERYPRATQIVYGCAFSVHACVAAWALLGRFNFRRRYAPRTERILSVVGWVNLGLAGLWGYLLFTSLGGA